MTRPPSTLVLEQCSSTPWTLVEFVCTTTCEFTSSNRKHLLNVHGSPFPTTTPPVHGPCRSSLITSWMLSDHKERERVNLNLYQVKVLCNTPAGASNYYLQAGVCLAFLYLVTFNFVRSQPVLEQQGQKMGKTGRGPLLSPPVGSRSLASSHQACSCLGGECHVMQIKN